MDATRQRPRAFRALAAHGLLAPPLAERLGQAVGMRNVLVHQYTTADVQLLARAVAEDLDDLRGLAELAGAWLAGEGGWAARRRGRRRPTPRSTRSPGG